jgi:hypothetical protein
MGCLRPLAGQRNYTGKPDEINPLIGELIFPQRRKAAKQLKIKEEHYFIAIIPTFTLCGLKIRFGMLCCFAPLREKYFLVNPNAC